MRKFSFSALVFIFCVALLLSLAFKPENQQSWVRINLLGYQPASIKVAVWASKGNNVPKSFELVNKKNRENSL